MPHADPARAAEYHAARHARLVADGRCMGCKKREPTPGRVNCSSCATKAIAAATSKARRRKQAGLCVRCAKGARTGRNTCSECGAAQVEGNRVERERKRDEVFAAYGGARCACCGEGERAFLTIDHVNDDGWEHRKTVRVGQLLGWLIRNEFPPGFQVLCMNCNWAKSRGGCPHQAKAR